jgi:hypothetical protein
MLLTLGHIARSITSMQLPPMLACTPYQMLYVSAIRTKINFAMRRVGLDLPGHRRAIERRPQAGCLDQFECFRGD